MSRRARNPACYSDIIGSHDGRAKKGPTMRLTRELIPYFAASAVGLALDVSLLWLQVSVIGVPYLAAAAVSFLTGTVIVYWRRSATSSSSGASRVPATSSPSSWRSGWSGSQSTSASSTSASHASACITSWRRSAQRAARSWPTSPCAAGCCSLPGPAHSRRGRLNVIDRRSAVRTRPSRAALSAPAARSVPKTLRNQIAHFAPHVVADIG